MKSNYLTKSQFCTQLGISRSYLHKLEGKGVGPRVVNLGDASRKLIPATELTDWLARHTELGGSRQNPEAVAA